MSTVIRLDFAHSKKKGCVQSELTCCCVQQRLDIVIQVYFLRGVFFKLWAHTGCSEVSFYRNRGVFAFLKIPKPPRPRLSSCTSNCFHSFTTTFSSQDFSILFRPSIVQVSAFCSAYRHSGILLVQCHRLAHCDGSTWKGGKSVCVHTALRTLHCDRTPWFCGYISKPECK